MILGGGRNGVYIWKKSIGCEDCGELVLDKTNLNLHLFIIQK